MVNIDNYDIIEDNNQHTGNSLLLETINIYE